MKNVVFVVALLVAAVCMAEDKAAAKTEGHGQRPGGHGGMPPHLTKEMIAKFDKDGDGKLSETEIKAAREAHQAETLKKFDKDGDGKLSEEEMKTAREARQAEFIKKFDKDGDGKLSDEEKKAAREAFTKEHPKAAEAIKEHKGAKKDK